jgi:hypothetical protein
VTAFVAVDHCTTECVGLHAAKKATRFEALEPLRQAVRDYCDGFRAGVAAGIRDRHDHGSQYMDTLSSVSNKSTAKQQVFGSPNRMTASRMIHTG